MPTSCALQRPRPHIPHIAPQAKAAVGKPAMRALRTSLERRMLAIGVVRLDHSKGLAERKPWHAMMARMLEHDIHAWRRGYLGALEAA